MAAGKATASAHRNIDEGGRKFAHAGEPLDFKAKPNHIEFQLAEIIESAAQNSSELVTLAAQIAVGPSEPATCVPCLGDSAMFAAAKSIGSLAYPIDPVLAFRARCEARSLLYHACELDLHEAVDALHDGAVQYGLLGSIGQDAVQTIMADAFRSGRENELPGTYATSVDEAPPPEPVKGGTPSATIKALMYALRGGLQCLADPANRDRLRRCDAAAMKEIAARLMNLNSRTAGRSPDWTTENVTKLVAAWRAFGRQS